MKEPQTNSRESKRARRARLRFAAAKAGVALVLMVLVIPAFSYPYLFDDFDFLVRVLRFDPSVLLPDPETVFYRPVSRELYFGLLQWLSPGGPLLGHALNIATLVLACLLSVQIGSRFLGPRGGILSGLFFAGFGQLPLLAAWVCGAQDALAILFTLGAFLLELRGRHFVALGSAVLAVLSKETAAIALPALALASRYLAPEEKRSNLRAADYLIVGVLWAALHPGIHNLVQRGFRSSGTEYIGFGNPLWYRDLLLRVPLLFNLPPVGLQSDWPSGLTTLAVLAAAMAVATFVFVSRRPHDQPEPRQRHFLMIAGLIVVAPMILTNLLLTYWAPYYLAFPAMGGAWLLAAATRRLPSVATAVLLGVYVLAGVDARGLVLDPEISTERNLARAASAMRKLEPQFRTLAPTLPPGGQVLVASQVRGSASVHVHLYTFQVFRQWYRDPTIRVVRPELRSRGRGPDLLFWINRDLDVFQIDLATMQPRSVGPQADLTQYQGTLRAYSRGFAESGELGSAVQTILSMPEATMEQRWLNRRLAASYLLAFAHPQEGRRLLRDAPSLDQATAVALTVELLAQPTEVPRYDRATLEAFDLDYNDPKDVAAIMEGLDRTKNPAAARFAERLLSLDPGNERALSLRRAYERLPARERITPVQPQR